ncbi:MAG: alpha-amylase family glycosyl hydrolase [Terrimicrobiaceae bacterium]
MACHANRSAANRTYHYWHVFVPGAEAGQIYGYRVRGPHDPSRGMRFDAAKLLLDPYGRGVVVPGNYSRDSACKRGENTATAMKSVVVDSRAYDWEGDMPLKQPWARTIIYEMHVRGFTRHPSSTIAEEKRGSFAGLVEKIPYLQQLGITAVELLPVFQFDVQDCPPGLVNYWGYAPVSFFAPHQAYSWRQDPLGSVDEFRDMVKALHRAGIEVILDVVFNHTAEGDQRGPTLCFRGIDNVAYYILEENRSRGSFIGDSWREWNGRFRDDVRSFFRGEENSVRRFADRIVGSPEIYGHKEREVEQCINFVTCHDGFTLNDLVSYNYKHNEANGEDNRDGGNDNRSWNCGVEGPTDDPAVEKLRNSLLGGINLHRLGGAKPLAIDGRVEEMLDLFPRLNLQSEKPASTVRVLLHQIRTRFEFPVDLNHRAAQRSPHHPLWRPGEDNGGNAVAGLHRAAHPRQVDTRAFHEVLRVTCCESHHCAVPIHSNPLMAGCVFSIFRHIHG